MTAPYAAAITEYVNKSNEWLATKMSTDIPNGMTDISSLQDLRRLVIKNINRTSFLAEQIEDNQKMWRSTQNIFSITERTEDVKTQQTFVTDSQYPKTLSELKLYCQSLKDFRKKLDILMNECLKGKALRSVSHLAEDGENYQAVISKLEAEFGNTLAIKESLFHSLQRLSPTTGKREDLRRFIDELEHICTRLERTGESVESLSIQTTILTKLPRFIQDSLLKSRRNLPTGNAWTTLKMRQSLKDILTDQDDLSRIVEMSRNLKTDDSPSSSNASNNFQNSKTYHSNKSRSQSGEHQQFPPTMSFVASKQEPSQNQTRSHSNNYVRSPRPKLPCLLCLSPEHYGDQCKVDIDTRRKNLREAGRCFRCIKTAHSAAQCSAPVPCKHCSRDGHHPYLCFKNPSIPNSQKFKPYKNIPNSNDTPLGQPNCFPFNSQYNPSLQSHQPETSNKQKHVHFPDSSQLPTFTNNLSHVPTGLTTFNIPDSRLAVLKCSNIAVFNVHNPNAKFSALLMLDDGSTNSFINKNFALRNGSVFGASKDLKLNTLGQQTNLPAFETSICFDLRSFGPCQFPMLAIDKISEAVPFISVPTNLSNNYDFGCVYTASEPDILIGNDYYYDINPIPMRKLPNGYILLDSEIGVLVGGNGIPSNYNMISQPDSHNFTSFVMNSILQQKIVLNASHLPENSHHMTSNVPDPKGVESLYDLETIGISSSESEMEENVVERIRSSITHDDSGIMFKYHSQILEMLDTGIIEEALPTTGPVHYLPHRHVTRADKPEKLRIVYDGSARPNKNSPRINEFLPKGPNLLTDLSDPRAVFKKQNFHLTQRYRYSFQRIPLWRLSSRLRLIFMRYTVARFQHYANSDVPFGLPAENV
ncbi:Zinc knuckle family protein [Ditylenchus destructor]|uniref:Zinc knuckle family protein n=1 Tax=Ditylenchus destructor TaxID=166010 RepID=A0AAD4MFX8_9BILA|nr:Zinc knuckle family protein [Ditylenchus destructor]